MKKKDEIEYFCVKIVKGNFEEYWTGMGNEFSKLPENCEWFTSAEIEEKIKIVQEIVKEKGYKVVVVSERINFYKTTTYKDKE